MNLPAINTSKFKVFSRDPNPKKEFRPSWGAKTEGIQEGDYIDGIILGFETGEYKEKNIILRSFYHNMRPVLVWGCGSLKRALYLHDKDDNIVQQLYFPGDVVRITFKGSYVGKKGLGAGKLIAIFSIDELVGYDMTEQDIEEVKEFQRSKLPPAPGMVQGGNVTAFGRGAPVTPQKITTLEYKPEPLTKQNNVIAQNNDFDLG